MAPGGIAIFSSSGMLNYGDLTYLEHPVYKHYVRKIHDVLVERGFWNDEINGEFIQRSNNVSPVLDRFSEDDMRNKMVNAGFEQVNVIRRDYPVDKEDMLARMRAGAASMYLFGGKYAEKISAEEREAIASEAVRKTEEEIPEQLEHLNKEPALEFLPVFYGIKPNDATPIISTSIAA